VDLSLPNRQVGTAAVEARVSPISWSAMLLTIALATIGVLASIATKFTLTSLPNIILMVTGIVILDVLSQFAPQGPLIKAVQTVLYGVLYVLTAIVCGILAAYSLQRIGFPLRDLFFAATDEALGFSWVNYARWVDSHVLVQTILHTAYDSIWPQLLLPIVVLAFSNRPEKVREYLLALTIAFVITIFISAMVPAAGPIIFVDRSSFKILQFTGATPIDHLVRLRKAGPLIMTDHPGGIATFPSFHATVATLIPLTLLRYPRIFVVLLILDAAMLAGTISEGAHYFTDVLGGIWMAFFGYAMARRVIALEDRLLNARRQGTWLPLRSSTSGLLPRQGRIGEAAGEYQAGAGNIDMAASTTR
jgi:hypothetical protein